MEDSCQQVLATGESTLEEAEGSRASLAALIEQLVCRAGVLPDVTQLSPGLLS